MTWIVAYDFGCVDGRHQFYEKEAAEKFYDSLEDQMPEGDDDEEFFLEMYKE